MDKPRVRYVTDPAAIASLRRDSVAHDDLIGQLVKGGAWVHDWSLAHWRARRAAEDFSEVRRD